ncbi:MAG TPA: calcium/proton exchanger [Candidatus Polarisedimenticolaceae bacterium]|nr:calcium/proton exchanger [Candidatus Polarisedimenticolaceae bacterium]
MLRRKVRIEPMAVLLVFVPVAVALELSHAPPAWVFGMSAAAIVPLAAYMGRSTEHLAGRMGSGVGGLLNATFGNAAELIIALVALRAGLYDVVKASITGSIIGNILLVLGLAILCGGIKHRRQTFNRTSAALGATLLVLSAIGLVVPAIFHHIVHGTAVARERRMSLEIAIVLFVIYIASLFFSLKTHRHLYTGEAPQETHAPSGAAWSLRRSLLVLAAATVGVAVMSEFLVGAVEPTAEAFGFTEVFVGVILVAIIGNAAEHSTAVLMAMKNQMDLAVNIAIGSSIQVALFVAPVLVFASHALGRPMDLVFSTFEVVAVTIAAGVATLVAIDGESNWMEGAQLLSVYLILGIAFYFLP